MRIRALVALRFALATFVLLSICAVSSLAATEKILHSFNGTLTHGSYPQSALVSDASGNFYGTTFLGGTYSLGTVYKLTPNSKGGWTQTVLYSFKGGSDGSYPLGSVIVDALGNVYGTTEYGGVGAVYCDNYYAGCGTVFKLAPNSGGGWTESVIHTFVGGSDGGLPEAGVVIDSAGNLYGTTAAGGSNANPGIVFKLTPTSSGGWTENIIHIFGSGTDGANPDSLLTIDVAGNLYATTRNGGTALKGTVFQLTPGSQGTWAESVLYNFSGGSDGSWPAASVVFDSTGNLYGTTTGGGGTSSCGTVFELKPNGSGGWSESVIHTFGSTSGDGAIPESGLSFDQSGNLYGTTFFGGSTTCGAQVGSGVVYQLTPSSGGHWTENIIYSFGSGSSVGNPYAGLLLQGGVLYGTSSYAGSANLGSVFKLTQSTAGSWTKKTIYWFPGSSDGAGPQSDLIADTQGNFYGTSIAGGLYGQGTVFKLSPKSGGGWTTTQLYAFKGGSDGSSPMGSLVFDTVGNLYGTTVAGGRGTVCGSYGCGTVFKLAPGTGGKWTESVLHSFTGGADGVTPRVGVAFSNGSLLGTTYGGGGNGTGCYPDNGCGVVFALTPASGGKWNETIVHTFTGGTDGANPGDGLLSPHASGNLYGTTIYTGCDSCFTASPTVFELSPNGVGGWTFTTIHEFVDLQLPIGGLVFDKAGNIYGTTAGSAYSGGPVVFQLTKSGGIWTENFIYMFSGTSVGSPTGGVTFDAAGNLYGTTFTGGNLSCISGGCGTVYKLAPGSGGSWNYSAVYAFNGAPTDASFPDAGVVFDSAGNLYGTTGSGGAYGGSGTSSLYGYGTVYEVTP